MTQRLGGTGSLRFLFRHLIFVIAKKAQ